MERGGWRMRIRWLSLIGLGVVLTNCGGQSQDFFADGPGGGTAGTAGSGRGGNAGQAGVSTNGGSSSAGQNQGGTGALGSGGGTAARAGSGSSTGGTSSSGAPGAGGTEAGGRAGSGGASGSDPGSGGSETAGGGGEGGEGESGGSAGAGGKGATCMLLHAQYTEALEAAKSCDPNIDHDTCTESVPDSLACPCLTYVNANNAELVSELMRIRTEADKVCEPQPCPAIVCAPPDRAACVGSTESGRCVTFTTDR